MLHLNLSVRRRRFARSAHSIISDAMGPAVCEVLEARRLLTTYSYTIPTTSPPHTVAYLQSTGSTGQIRVVLDDPISGTVGHTFSNQTGMDIIDAGSNSNFLFVDQVHAVLKPAADGNGDNGIKVQGGSGAGTLRVEAGDD